MSWGFRPYVPVAIRHAQAQKKIEKLKKKGQQIFPIEIAGRKIVSTFWGQSWCTQIESFSDFSNRLPRGRTYVRNGSVCHLEISKGVIKAIVAGSELYNIKITIQPIDPKKWQRIKQSCSGKIGSILDLLSGKLTEGVMETVCHQNKGLFPLPDEIKLSCDCPDWAIMCKHVAAVLYGVGARLDNEPAELFRLRAVNMEELIDITQAVTDLTSEQTGKGKRLSTTEVSNIFDIDLASDKTPPPKPVKKKKKTKAQSTSPLITIPKIITGISITKRRAALSLTKSACATALKVSIPTLSKWEAFGRKKVRTTEKSMKKLLKLWNKTITTRKS